jgi:neutral ceramidase
LRAGIGSQIINPPAGVSLGGYFHERIWTNVHDDIMAKALVLDDGAARASIPIHRDKTTVAIAVCDLQAIMGKEVAKARELASKATGIPTGNILISATHTHTGPQVRRNRSVPTSEEYLDKLPQMIADAIIQAHASLKPATLRLGEEYEDRLAFNRRFRMKDGRVVFNPRKQDPDILGPAGPIDPQINVLRVDDEEGLPIAILANYACHPDVMSSNEVSADFPGESSRIVSSLYESKPLVIYMQGTAGNINHRDINNPDPQKGPAEVKRIARILAGKILAASELSDPIEGMPLTTSSAILDIAYHPLTDELRAKAEAVRKNPDAHVFDKSQADQIEHYQLDGKKAAVEVQAIRIGDTAVVGIPGEYFVEYGLSIKEFSPFDQTFVAELANNTFGYIPTLDAFYPGTYETMPIVSAMLEPSAGVQMGNAAGKLLRELRSS